MLTLNYTRSLKRFSLSLALCPSLSHSFLSLPLLSLPLFRSCCLCRDSFVFAIEFSLRCVAIRLRLAHSHPLAVSLTHGTPRPCLAAYMCVSFEQHLCGTFNIISIYSSWFLFRYFPASFHGRQRQLELEMELESQAEYDKCCCCLLLLLRRQR